ncbi:MAG: hypothetical protein ACXAEU_15675 [Candidatus Hodarchaeales archaeon]|jgi:predicted HicB family RNase H-like nuclease
MSVVNVGIPKELHKKLKIEAVKQEKQLKVLLAEILTEYFEKL